MTQPAPRGDVESFAAKLPDQYLACRRWGHAWTPLTVTWVGKGRYYEEVTECARCTAQKTTELDDAGFILRVKAYAYPDGYVQAGMGRLDRAGRSAYRSELLARSARRRR